MVYMICNRSSMHVACRYTFIRFFICCQFVVVLKLQFRNLVCLNVFLLDLSFWGGRKRMELPAVANMSGFLDCEVCVKHYKWQKLRFYNILIRKRKKATERTMFRLFDQTIRKKSIDSRIIFRCIFSSIQSIRTYLRIIFCG